MKYFRKGYFWDVFCLLPPCGFQDLSGELDITNLPSADFEVPLQGRERRQVDLLRDGLSGFLREVAVADEEPHHREVLSAPPSVHLKPREEDQGLLQDCTLGGFRWRGSAGCDVHVPHEQADLWSRKLRSIAVRKLRSIAVGQVEGLPVHVGGMTRVHCPGA